MSATTICDECGSIYTRQSNSLRCSPECARKSALARKRSLRVSVGGDEYDGPMSPQGMAHAVETVARILSARAVKRQEKLN